MNQILKITESSNPEVIGMGVNNCFSKNHLDLKTQICEKFFNVQLLEEFATQISGNFEHENKL